MKKWLIICIAIILGALFGPGQILAENQINLYFFYGDGCPHCAKEEIFLDKLEKEKDNIAIYRYETWHNFGNAQLLSRVAKELNIKQSGVPILIVGDRPIIGYSSDQTTGQKILAAIAEVEDQGCDDIVAAIVGLESEISECVHGCEGEGDCIHNCGCQAGLDQPATEGPETVSIPFLGEINIRRLSLPVFAFLIAATDGFNPCAMWVLLFLISLLLGLQDRKRMWILGASFIITSGAVYFLFLAAWLNIFLFLGFIIWVRLTVGLVALASGGWHLKEAWRNRDGGCHVTENEKRRKIFARLRALASEKSFWLALSGIVLLAMAVNLVELVCSAGLPAVYTQVLALAGLPAWQHYTYLLLYIFIFMLDDLLVFIVAMSTLKMKAISSRYTQWSGWVGGVIMIVVGLLLLFKPGWLMFG